MGAKKYLPIISLIFLLFIISIDLEPKQQTIQDDVSSSGTTFPFILTFTAEFGETTEVDITIVFETTSSSSSFGGGRYLSDARLEFDGKSIDFDPGTSQRIWSFQLGDTKIISKSLVLSIEVTTRSSSLVGDSFTASSEQSKSYHFFTMSDNFVPIFQVARVAVVIGILAFYWKETGDPFYNWISTSIPSAKQQEERYVELVPTNAEQIAVYSNLHPSDTSNRLAFSIIPLSIAYITLVLTSVNDKIVTIVGFLGWIFLFAAIVGIVIFVFIIIRYSMWTITRYSQKVGFYMDDTTLLVVKVKRTQTSVNSYSMDKFKNVDTKVTKEMVGLGNNNRMSHEISLLLVSDVETINLLTVDYADRKEIDELINQLSLYGFVELEEIKVPKTEMKQQKKSTHSGYTDDSERPKYYCKSCNLVETIDDSKFCSNCGTILSPL